jgi:hypothetical protein
MIVSANGYGRGHEALPDAAGCRRHAQLAAPVLVPLHNLDPHPSWMSPGVDLHVANVPEDVPRIERNFRRAYQRAELRLRTATPPVGLRLPGGGIGIVRPRASRSGANPRRSPPRSGLRARG